MLHDIVPYQNNMQIVLLYIEIYIVNNLSLQIYPYHLILETSYPQLYKNA